MLKYKACALPERLVPQNLIISTGYVQVSENMPIHDYGDNSA